MEPSDYTYEYFSHRGISKLTMEFYDVKTKVNNIGKPISAVFTWPNGASQVRLLDKKEMYTIRNENGESTSGLFGRDKFSAGSHKFVTITEGAYDALSLYEVLHSPVVSVQSSSSAVRDCSLDMDWLRSFERVYLAFDGDAQGREAASRVSKLFDPNKVYLVRLTKRKDANDYLRAGEGDELKHIWWNSKKYLPENIISSFSDFEHILNAPDEKGIPYPFPTLNAMTYGMRPSESILITAQEGVGKTELVHALEYQLLRELPDDQGVGAIYLEEPKRRHLQAIAGLHLQKPVHLPDSGCSASETLAAVKEAVRVDDRLHVYSHFGSDDPETLVDTIRFLVVARSCRAILLDHITMAVSGLAGEDERRALDFLSTRLEMLVKELKFILIIVSHVNDTGQTRGSRYISKVADVRIDLERDIQGGDNKTYLTVSKNRFSGKTGPAGVLEFDRYKHVLEEKAYAREDNVDTLRTGANDNLPLGREEQKEAA